MNSPLQDMKGAADVRTLIDRFYNKVQRDTLLEPIFNEVAKVDWEHHLPIMYQFWETMLFRTGGYSGKPFPKHLVLPLRSEHFIQWLTLFRQTVDESFTGPKAEEAKKWAEHIAHTFQQRMNLPISADQFRLRSSDLIY